MLCGGLGLVVAAVLYFGWRNSENKWKREIAYIAGFLAIISVVVYVINGLGLLLGLVVVE